MLRWLIGEDIELTWLPQERLQPVKMDPTQLDQILANLCVNARDAIDGVGKITIETGHVTFDQQYCDHHLGFRPGNYIMLAVSDNGVGIDRETLKYIFEPYFVITSYSIHYTKLYEMLRWKRPVPGKPERDSAWWQRKSGGWRSASPDPPKK